MNQDKVRDFHLRSKYGISAAEYERLRNEQGGLCAVCGHRERGIDKRSGKVKRLTVDHNHMTGSVRGLVCTRCNFAIGYVLDNPKIADAVAYYLRASVGLVSNGHVSWGASDPDIGSEFEEELSFSQK